MGDCCDADDYADTFGSRFARRTSRRYRRGGLNPTQRAIVEFVAGRGLDGATVLEIGGGVGHLHVELLRRGAARVTNLELSSGYEAEAVALLSRSGMEGRVTRRMHDIATDPDPVEAADVVVLHRVVCCYPDYERLLGAAGRHSRRLLVYSYPPRSPFVRASFGLDNLGRWVRRKDFRAFVHPPAAMAAVVEGQGFHPHLLHRTRSWHVAGFER